MSIIGQWLYHIIESINGERRWRIVPYKYGQVAKMWLLRNII